MRILQELNKFYSPFSSFAGVLRRHFGRFVLYVSIHFSLHNAVCMSMAICISKMSCCILRSLPFSKTCEKVFEMSFPKVLNIHSMFANARYKFYCQKHKYGGEELDNLSKKEKR